MTHLVGKTLRERYFLRQRVGSGGTAEVYLAWDKLRSVRMAVKVLRQDLASNVHFFRRFAKEAELLRRLEHPHIVRLYEFERDETLGVTFLVMEWVDGEDLRRTLGKRKAPFSGEEALHFLYPVSSALHFAHQLGVYHCDVKPANILLHNDGRVLITDFGVARMAQDQEGGGTPPYMAPEQILGQPVDARTDVYALGVTLYELLSGGQLPFMGHSTESQGSTTKERITWEHLHLSPPPLRRINPAVSEAVEAVILTALQKTPQQRFPTVLALREAFERAVLQQILPDLPASDEAFGRKAVSEEATSLGGTMRFSPSSPPLKQTKSSLPPTSKHKTLMDVFKEVGRGFSRPVTSAGVQRQRESRNAEPRVQQVYLIGRWGDWHGQTIFLPIGETTLGRGAQNQVRFSDRHVSRRHATIIRTRKGVYIRDEGSSVGTFVNEQRIAARVPVLLHSGDIIRLGFYQTLEFRGP